MPQGNMVEVLGREVRRGSPGELMVESSPSRQRRPPCKTSKEMSDEAAEAAALTYLLTTVCSEEPPYHTAEELWEGLKQGDEGARLLFVFFLRLHKNERTRCSIEKAIAAEGKRLVGVLIEEAWHLQLLMRHRAIPYQGKPKSVVAVEGSRAQRRILARSGLARYSAPSLKEKGAVRLQTTWNKIH